MFNNFVSNLFVSDVNTSKLAKHSKADPDDYFHALAISWKDVPSCCTEPFILKGYLLCNMPWRYILYAYYVYI